MGSLAALNLPGVADSIANAPLAFSPAPTTELDSLAPTPPENGRAPLRQLGIRLDIDKDPSSGRRQGGGYDGGGYGGWGDGGWGQQQGMTPWGGSPWGNSQWGNSPWGNYSPYQPQPRRRPQSPASIFMKPFSVAAGLRGQAGLGDLFKLDVETDLEVSKGHRSSTPPPTRPFAPERPRPHTQPRRPTERPTRRPIRRPTRRPAYRPSQRPTRISTRRPFTRPYTRRPTERPTRRPTERPTRRPTERPTRRPTQRPTFRPTRQPTRPPFTRPVTRPLTRIPTRRPTERPPTRRPTDRPITRRPTIGPPPTLRPPPTFRPPTRRPTTRRPVTPSPVTPPSDRPTPRPTNRPATAPLTRPTRRPTLRPTTRPTRRPTTRQATRRPTTRPTRRPTRPPPPGIPTGRPTRRPTQAPTRTPTRTTTRRVTATPSPNLVPIVNLNPRNPVTDVVDSLTGGLATTFPGVLGVRGLPTGTTAAQAKFKQGAFNGAYSNTDSATNTARDAFGVLKGLTGTAVVPEYKSDPTIPKGARATSFNQPTTELSTLTNAATGGLQLGNQGPIDGGNANNSVTAVINDVSAAPIDSLLGRSVLPPREDNNQFIDPNTPEGAKAPFQSELSTNPYFYQGRGPVGTDGKRPPEQVVTQNVVEGALGSRQNNVTSIVDKVIPTSATGQLADSVNQIATPIVKPLVGPRGAFDINQAVGSNHGLVNQLSGTIGGLVNPKGHGNPGMGGATGKNPLSPGVTPGKGILGI